jgi:hypothetical protein
LGLGFTPPPPPKKNQHARTFFGGDGSPWASRHIRIPNLLKLRLHHLCHAHQQSETLNLRSRASRGDLYPGPGPGRHRDKDNVHSDCWESTTYPSVYWITSISFPPIHSCHNSIHPLDHAYLNASMEPIIRPVATPINDLILQLSNYPIIQWPLPSHSKVRAGATEGAMGDHDHCDMYFDMPTCDHHFAPSERATRATGISNHEPRSVSIIIITVGGYTGQVCVQRSPKEQGHVPKIKRC